jgi:hypothetical protein
VNEKDAYDRTLFLLGHILATLGPRSDFRCFGQRNQKRADQAERVVIPTATGPRPRATPYFVLGQRGQGTDLVYAETVV